MQVKFESKGGFDNVLKWMDSAANIKTSMAKQIADYGVAQLSQGTPKDTGETAQGWESEVTVTKSGIEVAWKNKAHPEAEVNVAKLIEFGHGTGTGGYVSPRPYIKQSMRSVWNQVDKDVEELMK